MNAGQNPKFLPLGREAWERGTRRSILNCRPIAGRRWWVQRWGGEALQCRMVRVFAKCLLHCNCLCLFVGPSTSNWRSGCRVRGWGGTMATRGWGHIRCLGPATEFRGGEFPALSTPHGPSPLSQRPFCIFSFLLYDPVVWGALISTQWSYTVRWTGLFILEDELISSTDSVKPKFSFQNPPINSFPSADLT